MDRSSTVRFTYEDLLALPESATRHEILDGKLYVTPTPRVNHQRVARDLGAMMHGLARKYEVVLLVLIAGLMPAGGLLDRRLVGAPEEHVRDELAAAPLILRDRFENQASARMMHAREVAASPVLAAARDGPLRPPGGAGTE
jgi:hypothetical protein